jgi:hypothetical protein
VSYFGARALPAQSLYRGETIRWLLPVVEPDGDAKDFTSAAVQWGLFLLNGEVAVSEKTLGTGVVFEGNDPTSGRIVVTVPNIETEALAPGGYGQEWRITDVIGDVQIYRGFVEVTNAAEWPA